MSGAYKAFLAKQKSIGKLKTGVIEVATSQTLVGGGNASSEEIEIQKGHSRAPSGVPLSKKRGSITRTKLSTDKVDRSRLLGDEVGADQMEDCDDLRVRKSKSDLHGHKRRHSHDTKSESSKKKSKKFDFRCSGQSNVKDIRVEEKNSWFHGSKPVQVFSGFHLLNDADQYVGKKRCEVADRAYRNLGQFVSDFVHLVRVSETDDEGKEVVDNGDKVAVLNCQLKSKDAEIESLKAALVQKNEDLQGRDKSLAILQKEMDLVRQSREEAIKIRDETAANLAKVSGDLDVVKGDFMAAERTLADERANKDALIKQKAELEKTLLAAGEESYRDCWDRFVRAGADGTAHTWEKYLEELEFENNEDGGDPEGKGENVDAPV